MATDLSFRFPRPVPGCSCTICTGAGTLEEELKRADNVPSPFREYKLVKLEHLAGADTTNKQLMRLPKREIDMSDDEFKHIETTQPANAVWAHPPPHQPWVKACLKILRSLSKQKNATYFLHPVDTVALNIPDYPTIILHPMDFSSIEKKLTADPTQYEEPDQFIDDVRFVFRNAFLYNAPEHPVAAAAKGVSAEFEKHLYSL